MSDDSSDISAFERRVESISATYTRLGWRFLAGPQRTLTFRAPFALITLNPGGARENPDHPRTSSEKGSPSLRTLHLWKKSGWDALTWHDSRSQEA